MEKERDNKITCPGLARRAFMKLGGASLLSLAALQGGCKPVDDGDFAEQGIAGNITRYWAADGLTPVQATVKNVDLANDTITARVEGRWRTLKIRELDQGFRDFQSNALVAIYDYIMTERSPFFGGVYCPAIISDGGIKRGDSLFKLNGAYKFVFPCPKEAYIDDITNGLMERLDDADERRTWMKANWADQSLWDYRIQVGRDETVMGPADQIKRRNDENNRETHTFRNLMENPLAIVLYLSSNNFISYEVRTICHYAAPPADFTTEPEGYEAKISRFINVLGYTSHQVDHKFPAMIFYTVEAFDNSMMVGFGEGTRVVKLRNGIKNMYAKARVRLIG